MQTDLILLLEDNTACGHMAIKYNKPMVPRSEQHIDTQIFKLLEFVEEEVLMLVKIKSHCNIADFLTVAEALQRESVYMARDYMFGVHNTGV